MKLTQRTALRVTAAALLFMLASAVTLQAQSTAEINGTVADPNGGAIAGAAVKLVNQATKIETDATTNQSGYFAFVNL
ncbi:MAG: carboxypeptidase-like regulatory domain-containing protein, partial [Pyrinomonadaceae bacterium]